MTSRYHGRKNLLITTIASLSNDDGDGNENGKKSNRFIVAKRQLCTRITLFCVFLNHLYKIAT